MNTNIFETQLYNYYKRCRENGVSHDTFALLYNPTDLAAETARRFRRAYALEKRVDLILEADETYKRLYGKLRPCP